MNEKENIGLRRQGYRLLLARGICIVLDVLLLGLFVATLPTYFTRLATFCATKNANTCSYGQLSADNIGALHALGLSLNAYAVLIVTLACLAELLCVAVAALLLWRKADNWSVLVVAVMLVGLGSSLSTYDVSIVRPLFGSVMAVPIAHISDYFGAVSLPLIFSLFPNGRFVPRWTRWLVLAMLGFGVIMESFPATPAQLSIISIISPLLWGVSLFLLGGAQIYRYRFVSSPVERQQTKWVIFGFTVVMLTLLLLLLPEQVFPPFAQPDSPYVIFKNIINTFNLTLPLALSFGFAILRYRLYDIDVLINRTLVYGVLTATLALVYLGIVLVLQGLVNTLTGQISSVSHLPLVVVASTLTIAALFQPLRRYIQTIIDRRFYRSKYDAVRTLAAFSTTLRDEVDLEQLREQVVAVVEKTMQPVHVSLWLRPTAAIPEAAKERKTHLLPRIDEYEREQENG